MAETNQELQTAIAQALTQAMGQVNGLMGQPSASPVPTTPMQAAAVQAPVGAPSITGWSVPVEQEINGMTVTLYLNFPAASFSQAPSIIMSLVNSGFQVRAFQKNNGGWNSGGSWGSRGASRYGGGFGRRY